VVEGFGCMSERVGPGELIVWLVMGYGSCREAPILDVSVDGDNMRAGPVRVEMSRLNTATAQAKHMKSKIESLPRGHYI